MITNLIRRFDDPVVQSIFNILNWEERFRYLQNTYEIEDYAALKTMDYDEFLLTVYWKIITAYLFMKRGKECGECHRRSHVDVHHKTYDHHGVEHEYLEDLCLRCKECHNKIHAPMNNQINELLKKLVTSKAFIPYKPVVNENYDSLVMAELKEHLR
jgi:5-methylcytosine-specific restriction endonuclease McrA